MGSAVGAGVLVAKTEDPKLKVGRSDMTHRPTAQTDIRIDRRGGVGHPWGPGG